MKKSFLGNAAIYAFGSLLVQASGFILLPLYTRALPPSSYGTLEVMNRIAEVLSICLMFAGIRQATFAFYKQERDERERRRVVVGSLVLVGVAALLGGGLMMALAGPLSDALGAGGPGLLRLAILVSLLDALTLIPLVVIQADVESLRFVTIMVGQFLVKVVIAILLVAVLRLEIWGVLAASAITSGVFGIALTARELSRGAPRPDRATLKAMTRFSLPFLPTGLCFFLLNSGDRFFLLRYAGEAEVGLYAIGYRLAMTVGLFSRTPLQMVWTAHMYEVAETEEGPDVFGRVFTLILAAYAFVGLGTCLLQDEVLAVLGGPAYAGASRVIAPVVLAYFFLTAADLMDAGLFVRRRTSRKVGIAAGSTAAMFLLYALLIPPLGAMGAALATLGGFIVHAALTRLVSGRVFPVRYEPARLAAMLVTAAALWIASRCLPAGWASLPAKLALWASWPALLWALGFVTPDEKRRVRSAARLVCSQFRRLPVPQPTEEL